MHRPILLFVALLIPAGVVLADSAEDRAAGKALFERIWEPAPTSADGPDGLGPLFAERSCVSCHGGPGDGASIAFNPDGIVARGVTAHFGDAGGNPDPVYGTDFQPRAVAGVISEGVLAIASKDPAETLKVTVTPGRGPFAPSTRISVRLSPSLVERARVEAADPAAVLALADPDDRNGDGISGRANLVPTTAGPVLGRFGWKATQIDLEHQIAHAFDVDMGLSSPLAPLPYGDCTAAEAECLTQHNGRSPSLGGEELSSAMIAQVAEYVRGLEPPPGPTPDPVAASLFANLGCAACHVPSLPALGGGAVTLYSDLLLHDLGPALDDGVGAPGVASAEWRTTPLTGLGWTGGSTRRYLHDGRTATLDGAIRAHGGEASAAAQKYAAATSADRDRLIAFLEHL